MWWWLFSVTQKSFLWVLRKVVMRQEVVMHQVLLHSAHDTISSDVSQKRAIAGHKGVEELAQLENWP